MRSIKFTQEELEFLQGQYELELIEAEKYIGEIKNILKKLGVITGENKEKSEPAKKRGRGRPAKAPAQVKEITVTEKSGSGEIRKKKRGRPRKPGPKKGSKRKQKPATTLKEIAKIAEIPAPLKPPVKKEVKKAKTVKRTIKRKPEKKAVAKAKTPISKKVEVKPSTALPLSPAVEPEPKNTSDTK